AGTCPVVVTRLFKATDQCGNQSTATQTITVDDTTDPVLAGPANTTVEGCSEGAIAGLAYSETAVTISAAQLTTAGGSVSDNCTVASVTYQDSKAGTCPVVVTRLFKATDQCGNQSTATQTITVDDTTDPVLAGPANTTVEGCSEGAIAGLAYSETAVTISAAQLTTAGGSVSDNCTVASVTYQDSKAGTCPVVVTRLFKATDQCGNQSPATQTITVDDTTDPVLAGPANTTVEGCSE